MKKLAAAIAALGLTGVVLGFASAPTATAPKPVAGSSWASIPDVGNLLDLLHKM